MKILTNRRFYLAENGDFYAMLPMVSGCYSMFNLSKLQQAKRKEANWVPDHSKPVSLDVCLTQRNYHSVYSETNRRFYLAENGDYYAMLPMVSGCYSMFNLSKLRQAERKEANWVPDHSKPVELDVCLIRKNFYEGMQDGNN